MKTGINLSNVSTVKKTASNMSYSNGFPGKDCLAGKALIYADSNVYI